jgi:hypothetical protein
MRASLRVHQLPLLLLVLLDKALDFVQGGVDALKQNP